ncbi:hypothetical protein D3C86_701430 [compost metagenome]
MDVNAVRLASLDEEAFFICLVSRKFTFQPRIQLTLGHGLAGFDRRNRVVWQDACHDVLLDFFVVQAIRDLEAVPSSQQDTISVHRGAHLTVSPCFQLFIFPIPGVHLVTDAVLDQYPCLNALRKLLSDDKGFDRTVRPVDDEGPQSDP